MRALLALDTADRTAGVAVWVDGEVRASCTEHTQRRHGMRIVPLCEQCLRRAELVRDELEAVAVTVGPGSFTGLRVGIATARGLATALGIPVVGVSTLEALGTGARTVDGLVVATLDAKKGQVYAAAYDGESGGQVLAPAAWEPDHLADTVEKLGRAVLWVGSGLGPYQRVWRAREVPHWVFAPAADWSIPPIRVAALGVRALATGSPAKGLTPVYCRRSEAEQKKVVDRAKSR